MWFSKKEKRKEKKQKVSSAAGQSRLKPCGSFGSKKIGKIHLQIRRQSNAQSPFYWETLEVSPPPEVKTVAGLLEWINEACPPTENNQPLQPIRWECSCLQKKCGACAMVINGTPRLACDAFLEKVCQRGRLVLEPLKKFPVVQDLMVNRQILYDNLIRMKTWSEGGLAPRSITDSTAGQNKIKSPKREEKQAVREQERENRIHQASLCLQCGCCLEVCPNFCTGNPFVGAAGFTPLTRLLSQMDETELNQLKETWLQSVYKGCGHSLACQSVCPAQLPLEELLVQSNALALWRKKDLE